MTLYSVVRQRKDANIMKPKLRIAYSLLFCFLLLTEICIALFIHDNFIRPYVGDVLVTTLICCFIRIFIPDKINLLPLFVFIFSCLVEISQYFDIVKLLGLENNRFLSIIIGRTFSIIDLLCYAVGCGFFFGISLLIKKICRRNKA